MMTVQRTMASRTDGAQDLVLARAAAAAAPRTRLLPGKTRTPTRQTGAEATTAKDPREHGHGKQNVHSRKMDRSCQNLH